MDSGARSRAEIANLARKRATRIRAECGSTKGIPCALRPRIPDLPDPTSRHYQ